MDFLSCDRFFFKSGIKFNRRLKSYLLRWFWAIGVFFTHEALVQRQEKWEVQWYQRHSPLHGLWKDNAGHSLWGGIIKETEADIRKHYSLKSHTPIHFFPSVSKSNKTDVYCIYFIYFIITYINMHNKNKI